jgi:hypothetical protein
MDTVTLVTEKVEDGEKLLQKLSAKGFDVSAAFWILPTDASRWRFYVVSPAVESDGPATAYRRLHAVARQLPQPSWIDPLEIKLIGPSNSMAQDVFAALNRIPGPKVSPIHRSGTRLGDVSIEGAYFYPLPTGASK